MTKPALQVHEVCCTFVSQGTPGQRCTAVRGVSLTVGEGKLVSVVGPTGFGDARAGAQHRLRRIDLGAFGGCRRHQLPGGMHRRTSLAQTLAPWQARKQAVRFIELHAAFWAPPRDEVLQAFAQQRRLKAA